MFGLFKNPHTELHEEHQKSINGLIKIIKLYNERIEYLEAKHLETLEEFKDVYKIVRDLGRSIKNLLEQVDEVLEPKKETEQ